MPVLRFGSRASVVCFAVLSLVLAWCVALPLWLGDGLNEPYFSTVASLMMFTPATAALIVTLLERRGSKFVCDTGIWPIRRPLRVVVAVVLAFVVPVLLVIQAPFVGTWLGVFPGDLENFALLHFVAGSQGPRLYLVDQAVLIVLAGLTNALLAIGEEVGWRGWLWPRLAPSGKLGAILISGVIWGTWHAPLILLGYNYPFAPEWGVLAMCGACTVLGAFLGWIRSYSDSVWPAALAHGVFNASFGLTSLFMTLGASLDTTQSSILGWTGWILPGLVIAIILCVTAFRKPSKDVVSTVR